MEVIKEIKQIENEEENEEEEIEEEETTLINIEEDDETYEIKANICSILSRELNLPKTKYDEYGTYDPPESHGIENCNIIIPYYYTKKNSFILDIEYIDIIKDDIKNMRPLNKWQMDYIKNLSHEEKNELFDIFNGCITAFQDYMM